jgi:hypothetical protein
MYMKYCLISFKKGLEAEEGYFEEKLEQVIKGLPDKKLYC